MTKKRRDFKASKGINALLSNINQELEEDRVAVVKELASNFAMLPIEQISPNPNQPRNDFNEEALGELAASIKALGVIQPITVKRIGTDQYEIISGERRYRASKQANIKEIPAYIRIGNDQELMAMALVENIQRKDLNAIEIAYTYSRLIAEFDLKHEELADRVGKKRSVITNYLRLLKLSPELQSDLREGKISMGHGRVLAGIQDMAVRAMLHKRIVEENLSVRQTEAIAAQLSEKKTAKSTQKPKLAPEYQRVQDNLKDFFHSKVNLKVNAQGKGQIVINFTNNDDLNRILDLLE